MDDLKSIETKLDILLSQVADVVEFVNAAKALAEAAGLPIPGAGPGAVGAVTGPTGPSISPW